MAFFGTPSMAVPTLTALCEAGLDVALVVTRADKRRGRGSELVPSPVKAAAVERGLTVSHRVDDVLDAHRHSPIELGVVVAFGALVKPHVLAEIPMVNLHVSLLPRWRGAAPIERAILAGDERTGVCLMQLEEGLDTGGIIDQREMPISDRTTAADIRTHLVREGTEMLLDHLRTGRFATRPQVGEVLHAAKIEPSERRIDWTRPAVEISRQVRIGDAWTTLRGRRLKIHEALIASEVTEAGVPGELIDEGVLVQCGRGVLALVEVQAEGRPRLGAEEWRRGVRLEPGEVFDRA
ncbi:MAG: methionyl-tRNA formyltransferase [Actinomycetota bacterium]